MSTKRRRLNNGEAKGSNDSVTVESAREIALTPATDEDKNNWQGFVDIDSDPVSLPLIYERRMSIDQNLSGSVYRYSGGVGSQRHVAH